MEVEDFACQLQRRLADKNEDSPCYRKASGVLASLLHAAKAIPNFTANYNATPTMALYISAGVFKLLKKTLDGDLKQEHNIDAYLLLLSMSLPQASPDALLQAGILAQLRTAALGILSRRDCTPFVTRLATAVLSHAVSPTMSGSQLKAGEERAMVVQLFEKAISSSRSNAVSRECAKLLSHLLQSNPAVSGVVAEEAKLQLLGSLDEKKQLYLANVKQLMAELPVRLLNDICHRVASNLSDMDPTDPTHDHYLAHTYFFLEKMTPRLLPSTLEDLLLVLVPAMPPANQSERVQLSYLQLLYEALVALGQSDEAAGNKLLSPVVSVLVEELLASQKIGKFAANLLVNILSNCVRPSLWRQQTNELSLDAISLQDGTHNFAKLICHLQSLLSARFTNTKQTAAILAQFFSRLQADAAGECEQLIRRVVDFREELHERSFRKVMQALLVSLGVPHLLALFPLSLSGDIASPDFEENNNLWLLSILEKTERNQSMGVFYTHILPLIQQCKQACNEQGISKQRREGYLLIEGLLWRCLKAFCRTTDHSVNYQDVLALIEAQLRQPDSESTQQQLALSLELISAALVPLRYRSSAAEQLIKTLAGMLDISSGNARQMTLAIKGLSRLAPADYVKRVFDKNIEKLIGLAESNNLSQEQDKNLKNLEILMAVNSAIDLADPSVTTKYRQSREELLLRLVAPLLAGPSLFQKKGYKYLNETLEAAPNSLYLQVLEVVQAAGKVEGGARHHRLSVLGRLWQWLRNGGLEENLQKIIGFIKTHLPQILLALRDPNGGARDEASRLVGEWGDSMEEMGLTESFVESVCAGLVGERSEMKLATLAGLAAIVAKGHCSSQVFREVLEIVLLLLGEKKQELYRGVVEFCRRGLGSLSVADQAGHLPSVLRALFEEDEEGKMEHRSILRHFLIKLTKKHGREMVEQLIPPTHRKMLAHTLKMENREKRKKREQNIARRQQYQQQKLEQQKREEEESESDGEPAPANDAMDVEEGLEELDNTNNLLLKYDLEKEQFHFQREQQSKAEGPKRSDPQHQEEITFDEKGIMVIEERKRQRAVEEEREEETAAQQKDVLNFKKKTKTEVHQVKQSGDTFKSTRAGGDVRLKDKPEPYAFIQFSSKALNKRFKKRAEHVFESLFEKKEGGLKGLKSRIATAHH